MLTKIEINPNLRLDHELTMVSLKGDVEGPIKIGDIVDVYESASRMEGKAVVRKIEGDDVVLRVAWDSLK